MSFRLRLTVLASLAVAVAIVGASIAVYYTDRHELLSQVDSDLSSSLALPRLNAVFAGGIGGVTRVSGGADFALPNVAKVTRPVKLQVVLPRSSTAV
jgi:hypothetical protein